MGLFDWESDCSLQKLLQAEMVQLHLAAHLCCSNCSTLGQSFPWYYFPVFCSHASLLEIVLQCVLACSFSLPYVRSPQFSSPYNSWPGVFLLSSIFYTCLVQWSCIVAKNNFTAVAPAVFQDFLLVNMFLLVMLTKIKVKHNDQYFAHFFIMAY